MTTKTKKYNYLDMPNEIFIKTNDLDSLFWYFYHVKTFVSWFCLPGMFFVTKDKLLKTGCVVRCLFPVPPFYWMKASVIDHKENKFYTYRFTGCMEGICGFEFIKKDNGYLVKYTLNVRGANLFLHILYQISLKLCHDLQTPYVLKKLKKDFEAGNYRKKSEIEKGSK